MGDADDDAGERFGLFAAAFAVALLLHQLWWNGFELWGFHALVALAAAWVLVRPGSVPRLLALLACELVAVARDAPGEGSHTLLAAVVAATVLAFVAVRWSRSRRLPEPGELFVRIAPFLAGRRSACTRPRRRRSSTRASSTPRSAARPRWPRTSRGGIPRCSTRAGCGRARSTRAWPSRRRSRCSSRSPARAWPGSCSGSASTPCSRWRATCRSRDSSSPSTSRSCLRAPSARARALLPARPVPRWAPPLALAAAIALWLLGAHAESLDPRGVDAAIGDATRLFVLALALALAATTIRVNKTPQRSSIHGRGLRLGHPVFAVGVAVLVANALTPYVGLKTESSMAMFSNLQTEGSDWNHLVIPDAVRVFHAQDHLVTVTASNAPQLLRRTRGGTRMVRFEVERYLRGHPGTWATVTPGRLDPDGPPLAGVVDRVAKFRDVRAAGRRGC